MKTSANVASDAVSVECNAFMTAQMHYMKCVDKYRASMGADIEQAFNDMYQAWQAKCAAYAATGGVL